jgi:hypothetical protein
LFNGGVPVTKEEARELANNWVAAWNAHDLDLIMSHYEEAIELTSPVAAQLLGKPDGRVAGRPICGLILREGWQLIRICSFVLKTCSGA